MNWYSAFYKTQLKTDKPQHIKEKIILTFFILVNVRSFGILKNMLLNYQQKNMIKENPDFPILPVIPYTVLLPSGVTILTWSLN
jgi:hypothetical protein